MMYCLYINFGEVFIWSFISSYVVPNLMRNLFFTLIIFIVCFSAINIPKRFLIFLFYTIFFLIFTIFNIHTSVNNFRPWEWIYASFSLLTCSSWNYVFIILKQALMALLKIICIENLYCIRWKSPILDFLVWIEIMYLSFKNRLWWHY